jgi:hypothetical protein
VSSANPAAAPPETKTATVTETTAVTKPPLLSVLDRLMILLVLLLAGYLIKPGDVQLGNWCFLVLGSILTLVTPKVGG